MFTAQEANADSRNIRYANTGYGPNLAVLDVGLADKVAVVEADTAFWALVEKDAIQEALAGELVHGFQVRAAELQEEMAHLRFGLKPSAVYLNPTDRCNFNCSYCYLPAEMRAEGKTMTAEELCAVLGQLAVFFTETLPPATKPQIIFHGSEPLLARQAVFAGISCFSDIFHFGLQTNAMLLDDDAISFLKEHGVGIGISLDGPTAEIADRTRKNWGNEGGFSQVTAVMEKLADYPAFNVITTVTAANVRTLPQMVDFYHQHGVKTVMFNPVRCTQAGGRELKPDNAELAHYFFQALDKTWDYYEKTGQKLVVANFANVLAGIAGPTSRRLMCDISPCGGGRCFFAVSAAGDVFPCSEFIGFDEFKGGNLHAQDLGTILVSKPFKDVVTRRIEKIVPCGNCVIRHFCGAPCPAEVKAVYGTLDAPSPYCSFYEEQVRYAFRVIAAGREEAYLWDGWREETEEVLKQKGAETSD